MNHHIMAMFIGSFVSRSKIGKTMARTMKIVLILLLLPSACIWLCPAAGLTNTPYSWPEPSESYYMETMHIPQQVLFSQLCGIGTLLSFNQNEARCRMLYPWRGAATNEVVSILPDDFFYETYPTNQLGLIFATTNIWWTWAGRESMSKSLFSWNVVTNTSLGESCRNSTNWHTVNDGNYYFPVTSPDAPLCRFASDLVNAAWRSNDEALFNEIIRGAAVTNAFGSEIARQARYYVLYNMNRFPANIVEEVLKRPDEP